MLTKIKIALVAALVASTASAALARTPYHNPRPSSHFAPVPTDQGHGREGPIDGPGIG